MAEAKRHLVTTYGSAAQNQEEWKEIAYVRVHQVFERGEGLREIKACEDPAKGEQGSCCALAVQ